MFFLSGKISDRLRSGKLPKDVQIKTERYEQPPATKAVKRAQGRGLGQGATRRRSGSE